MSALSGQLCTIQVLAGMEKLTTLKLLREQHIYTVSLDDCTLMSLTMIESVVVKELVTW